MSYDPSTRCRSCWKSQNACLCSAFVNYIKEEMKIMGPFDGVITNKLSEIRGQIQQQIERIRSVILNVGNAIVNVPKDILNGLINAASSLAINIVDMFKLLVQFLPDAVAKNFTDIFVKFDMSILKNVNDVENLLEQIADALKTAIQIAVNFGFGLINLIMDSVTGFFNTIFEYAARLEQLIQQLENWERDTETHTETSEHDDIQLEIFYKRLSNNAVAPAKQNSATVGYDLCSAYDAVIPSGKIVNILTDLTFKLPENVCGQILGHSDDKMTVLPSFIDANMMGRNLAVKIFNTELTEQRVKRGTKIGEIIFLRSVLLSTFAEQTE